MVSPLSRESTVGTLEATVFSEIRDLIPLYVFLILFQVETLIFVLYYLSRAQLSSKIELYARILRGFELVL